MDRVSIDGGVGRLKVACGVLAKQNFPRFGTREMRVFMARDTQPKIVRAWSALSIVVTQLHLGPTPPSIAISSDEMLTPLTLRL